MGRDRIMIHVPRPRVAAETPLAAARSSHTAGTPQTHGARGLAVVTSLLLLLTGCGVVDRDDRPESDYATFAQEVAALPAIASVDTDPGVSGEAAERSFVAELTDLGDLTDVADPADVADPSEVSDPSDVTDPSDMADPTDVATPADHTHTDGPGTAGLKTTGDRITSLLDDYKYPDGVPSLTLTSGSFSASLPWDPVVPPGVDPIPNPLDLTDLPQLSALPDVAEGALGDGQVSITLTTDTDLRPWVEDALTREGTSLLTVEPAEATAQTSESSDPDESPDPSASSDQPEPPDQSESGDQARSTEEFTFRLGSNASAEAVTALFSVTDSVGATVLTGVVDGETQPTADFLIPTADILHPLLEALVDEYGGRSSERFSVDTEDGLHVDFPESFAYPSPGSQSDEKAIDDVLAAQEQLDAVDATLTSVSLDRGAVEVEVRNGDVLRDVAEVVGSQEWPFGPEGTVSVHHPDSPSDHPYFRAANWGDHADLLASLWDAGFTSVRYSGHSDPSVRVSHGQGPDFTAPSGRDALIRTLRDAGWSGTLRVSLAEDPHPTFESTATGTAQNPYNSLLGTDDEPYGWGLAFIEAWDASAG
ncbi:hypothetical protein [Brevibacterium yomogidense]|uniref:hypothetical protein n=1 Tax=Brevibacterium yomogidense TaxID=946573 RepID=UPI0018E02D46|nr:hypothetical protein [Brevibacterium yomogidense]